MSTSTEAMGGRLALAERSSLTEPQRALFDRLTQSVLPWAERAGFASRSRDGRFIGPFKPALLSPAIAGRFLDLQAAEQESAELSERVRQVAILAVGAVWRSAYELYAHSAAARTAGLSEKAVDALAAGGVPDEPSHTERCARQLSADRRIDQAVYDEASEAFGTRGLVASPAAATAVGTVGHEQRRVQSAERGRTAQQRVSSPRQERHPWK